VARVRLTNGDRLFLIQLYRKVTYYRWRQEFWRTVGPQHVFIDTDSIRMGDDWPERIDNALASATILIPVIGPNWLKIADDYGRRRLDRADDWVCNGVLLTRTGKGLLPRPR
jgi:hypothetical protein